MNAKFSMENSLVSKIMNILALYVLKISGQVFENQLKIFTSPPRLNASLRPATIISKKSRASNLIVLVESEINYGIYIQQKKFLSNF